MSEVEKCWSQDGETFHVDWDCITDYGDEELVVGYKYYEGDSIPETHQDYIHDGFIDSILENLDEALSWEHGDYFDSCYQDTTDAEKEELRQLILGWAEKNVKMKYYKVRNVVEKVITEEDLG